MAAIEEPQEGESTNHYDQNSSIFPDVRLLNQVLPADSAKSTFVQINLTSNPDLAAMTRPRINLFLVLDRSTSWAPGEFDKAKAAACLMLQALLPGDRCLVIGAGASAHIVVPWMTKGESPLVASERQILALKEENECDLLGAVIMAGWRAQRVYDELWTNRLFILSPGFPRTSQGLADIVQGLAKECIYTHVFSTPGRYNVELLVELVDAGLGNYHIFGDLQQLSDVLQVELTGNQVAGRNIRLCLRPRHSGIEIDEVVSFDCVKEDDTMIIDVGDLYMEEAKDVLIRLTYKVPPGRREVIEVHVSHHDGDNVKHLKTFQLGAMFVLDEAETMASMPNVHVADKVLKVRAALALNMAIHLVKENNSADGIELLTAIVQKLGKAQAHGSPVLGTLAAYLRDHVIVALTDATSEADVEPLKKELLAKSRSLMREYS